MHRRREAVQRNFPNAHYESLRMQKSNTITVQLGTREKLYVQMYAKDKGMSVEDAIVAMVQEHMRQSVE